MLGVAEACVTADMAVDDADVSACLVSCGSNCSHARLVNATSMPQAIRLQNWLEYQLPIVSGRLERASNASRRSGVPSTVFFGDSIFAMAADKDAFLLCARRPEPCANAGVGFDTWRLAWARAWQVCAVDPGLLFVLLGTNDLLRRAAADVVASRAAKVLRYLRRCTTSAIVLVALPPHDARRHAFDERAVNRLYRTVAAAEGVGFCDVHEALVDDARLYLRQDGLHLSPAGYEKLNGELDECIKGE